MKKNKKNRKFVTDIITYIVLVLVIGVLYLWVIDYDGSDVMVEVLEDSYTRSTWTKYDIPKELQPKDNRSVEQVIEDYVKR